MNKQMRKMSNINRTKWIIYQFIQGKNIKIHQGKKEWAKAFDNKKFFMIFALLTPQIYIEIFGITYFFCAFCASLASRYICALSFSRLFLGLKRWSPLTLCQMISFWSMFELRALIIISSISFWSNYVTQTIRWFSIFQHWNLFRIHIYIILSVRII